MVIPTTKNDWRASLDSRAFVFITGEAVESAKKEKAKFQKENLPDTFHIFTQEGVAKVLGINLS